METIKAVCECKNLSEDHLVISVKKERFDFIDGWGIFKWLLVLLLSILTAGVWILVILVWKSGEIVNPKYYCSQCKNRIPENQFRS